MPETYKIENKIAGTSNYIDDGWAHVRLDPNLMDLSRMPIMKLLRGHESDNPVAKLYNFRHEGVNYLFDADVPIIDANVKYRQEYEAGLRDIYSMGFRITRLELVEIGETWRDDKFNAAWQLMEVSDEPIPADIDAVGSARSVYRNIEGYDEEYDIIVSRNLGLGIMHRSVMDDAIQQATAARKQQGVNLDMNEKETKDFIEELVSKHRGLTADEVADIVRKAMQEQRDADEQAVREAAEKEAREKEREKAEEERITRIVNAALDARDARNAETRDDTREDDDDEEREMDDDEERGEDMDDDEEREYDDDDERKGKSDKRSGDKGAKLNDKKSKRYGGKTVIADGMMKTRNKHGDEGMQLGGIFKAAFQGGRHLRTYSRETELLEERDMLTVGRDGRMLIQYDDFAKYGRHAQTIKEKLAKGEGWRQTPVAGLKQDKYLMDTQGGGQRAISTGLGQDAASGGGALPVVLDVAASQMWLYEASNVLGMMNPIMGITSEYKAFYGNVAPTGSMVPEGGNHTANSPSLTEITRRSRTVHVPWSVTSDWRSMDGAGVGILLESAVENQLMDLIKLLVVSGPGVGGKDANGLPLFTSDTNAINGLMSSGITFTNYGTGTPTDYTGFTRDTVIDAHFRLQDNKALGSRPFWILNTKLVNQAAKTRVGGNESVLFVADASPDAPYEGRIGGSVANEGTRFVNTQYIGKANTGSNAEFERRGYGVFGYGSQMLPLFFGNGIEVRFLQDPDETNTQFALLGFVNYAQINPRNATGVKLNGAA